MAHVDFIEKNAETSRVIVRQEIPGEFLAIRRLIYFILDVLVLVLLGRFVLKLLGAAPGGGFVNFIYTITEPLVAPFRGIFPVVAAAGTVLEWSALLAMAVYAVIAYLLIRLLRLLFIK